MDGPLNNREVATAAWAGVMLLWSLCSAKIRRSIGRLFVSALRPKLVTLFMLAGCYVTLLVVGLRRIGVWTPEQANETVFWFFFTGVSTAFGLINSWKGESLFHRVTVHTFKIAVVVEFLTSEYTLPLSWELLLVPSLASLGALQAVAGHTDEFAAVRKLLGWVQTALAILIVGTAIHGAVADWDQLRSLKSLRSLVIAPILSLLFTPFVCALLLYVTYENLFSRFHIAARDNDALRRYARRRFLTYFGLRLTRLRKFTDEHGADLWSISSNADLEALLGTLHNPS
jgi:uncharacterized membrane protein YidH (DUF202 family)